MKYRLGRNIKVGGRITFIPYTKCSYCGERLDVSHGLAGVCGDCLLDENLKI